MNRILYHRTTPELADAIRAQGRFISAENTASAFFSTHLDGQADGYGTAVVEIHVPAELFDEEIGQFGQEQGWLDDQFPSGEQHWALSIKAIRPEWIQLQPAL